MNVDPLQTVLLAEADEPFQRGMWRHGHTVPLREHPVVILPLVTDLCKFLALPVTVLPQHIHDRLRHLQHTVGTAGLRCVGVCPFSVGVLRIAADMNGAVFKADVLPFQTEQLALSHAAVNSQCEKHTVRPFLALKQFQKL